MDKYRIVDLTPENFTDYGVCGYKDVAKHKELRAKLEWFTSYYSKGLRIKVIDSETGGYQGMIEYIPGEFAHRPVKASGYMFIHCIFTGFKKEFKGRGYASSLINACISEAKDLKMSGVSVVVRNGSFMANREVFLKNGFEVIDGAKPDFELLVARFGHADNELRFNHEVLDSYSKYDHGLTIFRSPQCPYTEKNVMAIIESAKVKYGIPVQLIDLKDHIAAQNTPSPFGTFAMVLNGRIISHHPISHTRFDNIMTKMK